MLRCLQLFRVNIAREDAVVHGALLSSLDAWHRHLVPPLGSGFRHAPSVISTAS